MTYALDDTIEQLLGPIRGGINAMAHCPLHEDRTPSLSIHREEGIWKCHSCGAAGDIIKLAELVGEELGQDFLWDRAIRSVAEIPPTIHNFGPLANKLYENGLSGYGDTAIRNFLRSRGIFEDARHHFWLGWDGSRISFPYWDDDSRKRGTAYAIKYRGLDGAKSYESGSKWSIYNVEQARGAGVVLLCEGESDTILAWCHVPKGIMVCGIPGASASVAQWEQWALDLLFARKIYVGLDADKAGDQGAERAINVLGDKATRYRPDEGLDLTGHFLEHGGLPDGLEG